LPARRARAASIAGADPKPIIETTGSLPLTAPQPPADDGPQDMEGARDWLSARTGRHGEGSRPKPKRQEDGR
jgi:hypothetical protein